ncbi:hypothetical protein NBRC116583_17610 [Arenicella sp. 4NH20-0111]
MNSSLSYDLTDPLKTTIYCGLVLSEPKDNGWNEKSQAVYSVYIEEFGLLIYWPSERLKSDGYRVVQRSLDLSIWVNLG